MSAYEWLERVVIKLTWHREVARMAWRVRSLERELIRIRHESSVYHECYRNNLQELHKAEELISRLRFRLSEQGRAMASRKPHLP